jgi:hypothetical protein
MQELDGFTVNLLDLNHGGEADAGLSGSHVDGETPVRVQYAREVSQEGWAVFHVLNDTTSGGEHTTGVCFLPDGDLIRNPDTIHWRDLLQSMHVMWDNFEALHDAARMAAALCDAAPAWSVDFALDRKGKVWLIDMATMDTSWHWPGCPNAPAHQKGS